MLYPKNLPMWERVLRLLAGAALIVYVLVGAPSLLVTVLALASAVVIVVTGFAGYCPACAVAGRKFIHQPPRTDDMSSNR